MTLPELQRDVPQLNWTEYLQATLGHHVRLHEHEPIVSYAMPYLVQMGRIVATTDRRVLQNYVVWRVVLSMMTHMIDDYQRVGFGCILCKYLKICQHSHSIYDLYRLVLQSTIITTYQDYI